MPKRKTRLGAGDLILNTPFVEPDKYWSYDRNYMIFTQIERRRPDGYIVANSDAKALMIPDSLSSWIWSTGLPLADACLLKRTGHFTGLGAFLFRWFPLLKAEANLPVVPLPLLLA